MSVDSFFHPINKPPKEYLQDENILEKPGRINIKDVKAPKLPLAGRLTEIGEQILLIGSQKAKFICTGQWDFDFKKKNGDSKISSAKSTFRPGFEKITSFNAFDYVEPEPIVKHKKPHVSEIDRLHMALKNGRQTPLMVSEKRHQSVVTNETPS